MPTKPTGKILPHQEKALRFILEAIAKNAELRVALAMPGKSIHENIARRARGDLASL